MQVHNISIDKKYFEPIRNGQITLLIFKQKIIEEGNPGDYVLASKGNYDVKAKITRTYIKAFNDITDEEAQKAGFLNKDFLEDELVNKYNLSPSFNISSNFLSTINEELFFLISISTIEEPFSLSDEVKKVNLYSKEYNKEFYKPNFEEKLWRDLQ